MKNKSWAISAVPFGRHITFFQIEVKVIACRKQLAGWWGRSVTRAIGVPRWRCSCCRRRRRRRSRMCVGRRRRRRRACRGRCSRWRSSTACPRMSCSRWRCCRSLPPRSTGTPCTAGTARNFLRPAPRPRRRLPSRPGAPPIGTPRREPARIPPAPAMDATSHLCRLGWKWGPGRVWESWTARGAPCLPGLGEDANREGEENKQSCTLFGASKVTIGFGRDWTATPHVLV